MGRVLQSRRSYIREGFFWLDIRITQQFRRYLHHGRISTKSSECSVEAQFVPASQMAPPTNINRCYYDAAYLLDAVTASASSLVDDTEMVAPSSVTASPPLSTSSPPSLMISPLHEKIRWCHIVQNSSTLGEVCLSVAVDNHEVSRATL